MLNEYQLKTTRNAKIEFLERRNLELDKLNYLKDTEIQYLKDLLGASESEERRLSEIIKEMSEE